jgi:hypothetical protein
MAAAGEENSGMVPRSTYRCASCDGERHGAAARSEVIAIASEQYDRTRLCAVGKGPRFDLEILKRRFDDASDF